MGNKELVMFQEIMWVSPCLALAGLSQANKYKQPKWKKNFCLCVEHEEGEKDTLYWEKMTH